MLVTPANAGKPVPLMIMFRGGGLPGPPGSPALDFLGRPSRRPGRARPAGDRAADRGGLGLRLPQSFERAGRQRRRADAGIIGLVNKGQRAQARRLGLAARVGLGRQPRARFLRDRSDLDAKRVGIDGVSRYGKAALVTMAFDPRFAVVLVGSSGEGGAKLLRRHFGEAVENLTGCGEYHWMAGNFLKYGAGEATFGSKNAGDIPVDAHQLIALCAPRPMFISYGVPEKGDAHWIDQHGSFMAAVAAQPAFRLLGARDLGPLGRLHDREDAGGERRLLDGALAWRQHDGGHTDGPTGSTSFRGPTRCSAGRRRPRRRPRPRPSSSRSAAMGDLGRALARRVSTRCIPPQENQLSA